MNKRNIIIIVIVVLLVLGVWLVKYFRTQQSKIAENTIQNSGEEVNEDFKLNIRSKIDLAKLKSYNLPIIIDFGADYCAPCRQMAPTIKKLNEELQGKAIIRYVDTGRFPRLADGYPVEYIPTQILFNSDGTPYKIENGEDLGFSSITLENGEQITAHVGYLSEQELRNMLKEMGLNE